MGQKTKILLVFVWGILVFCLATDCNSSKQKMVNEVDPLQKNCLLSGGADFYLFDSLFNEEINKFRDIVGEMKEIETFPRDVLKYRKTLYDELKKEAKDTFFYSSILLTEFIQFIPRKTSDVSYYNYNYTAIFNYLNCENSFKRVLFSLKVEEKVSIFEVEEIVIDSINTQCDFLLKLGLDYSPYFENRLKLDSNRNVNNVMINSKIGRYNEYFCRILPNPRFYLNRLREEISLTPKPQIESSNLQILEKIDLMVNLFDCSFDEMVRNLD